MSWSRRALAFSRRALLSSAQSKPPTVIAHEIPLEEERIDNYDPKHFYPVKIGEVFNFNYKIATKLGFGGSSTVWLARDLRR